MIEFLFCIWMFLSAVFELNLGLYFYCWVHTFTSKYVYLCVFIYLCFTVLTGGQALGVGPPVYRGDLWTLRPDRTDGGEWYRGPSSTLDTPPINLPRHRGMSQSSCVIIHRTKSTFPHGFIYSVMWYIIFYQSEYAVFNIAITFYCERTRSGTVYLNICFCVVSQIRPYKDW